jgi:hypothetical protein
LKVLLRGRWRNDLSEVFWLFKILYGALLALAIGVWHLHFGPRGIACLFFITEVANLNLMFNVVVSSNGYAEADHSQNDHSITENCAKLLEVIGQSASLLFILLHLLLDESQLSFTSPFKGLLIGSFDLVGPRKRLQLFDEFHLWHLGIVPDISDLFLLLLD